MRHHKRKDKGGDIDDEYRYYEGNDKRIRVSDEGNDVERDTEERRKLEDEVKMEQIDVVDNDGDKLKQRMLNRGMPFTMKNDLTDEPYRGFDANGGAVKLHNKALETSLETLLAPSYPPLKIFPISTRHENGGVNSNRCHQDLVESSTNETSADAGKSGGISLNTLSKDKATLLNRKDLAEKMKTPILNNGAASLVLKSTPHASGSKTLLETVHLMPVKTKAASVTLRSALISSEQVPKAPSKEDPGLAKFKDRNLEIYHQYYGLLFRDCVATGERANTPQLLNDNIPCDVEKDIRMTEIEGDYKVAAADDETNGEVRRKLEDKVKKEEIDVVDNDGDKLKQKNLNGEMTLTMKNDLTDEMYCGSDVNGGAVKSHDKAFETSHETPLTPSHLPPKVFSNSTRHEIGGVNSNECHEDPGKSNTDETSADAGKFGGISLNALSKDKATVLNRKELAEKMKITPIMADVARGHGGHARGTPPDQSRQLPSACLASGSNKKTRGRTTNMKLRDLWSKNGSRPLPIEFDIQDQRTLRPVGRNASHFKNLVGTTIRNHIPMIYEKWDRVPQEYKANIWPTIETFFNMRPHLDSSDGKNIVTAIDMYCADRYSDSKYRFKQKWFNERGGSENEQEIRGFPPPDMSQDDWNKHVDYYMNDRNVNRSKTNTSNRSNQPYSSRHGTRAYVEYRHARHAATGQYPSLIEGFADMHRRNGTYNSTVAQQQHEAMQELWNAQLENSNPLTEEQIMAEVLGTRRGHNRGRGRIVRGSSSSDTPGPSTTPGRVYTQTEVDAMFATQQAQIQSQFEAFAQSLSAQYGLHIPVPSYPPPTQTQFQDNEDDEATDDE